jgi:hypothetical protein
MARHGSVSDLTADGVPVEISDVITMPIALQAMNLEDAMETLGEDLLNLNEALVTQTRRQVRVVTQECQKARKAFLEVKCRLHDVLGGK